MWRHENTTDRFVALWLLWLVRLCAAAVFAAVFAAVPDGGEKLTPPPFSLCKLCPLAVAQMMAALIEHGASVDVVNRHGRSVSLYP